ncbi:MAG: Fe(2+)-trafficking protein [Planctomycetota bacterium]|jgi:Fe-S cluster biosynthesis and repair protein YggX
MAEVSCARCGSTAPGLPQTPLPGEAGSAVLERTCAACWQEWLGMQVQLINEWQLSPADPEHFERLVREMRTFLGLGDAGATHGPA